MILYAECNITIGKPQRKCVAVHGVFSERQGGGEALDIIEYGIFESSLGNIALISRNGLLIELIMQKSDIYRIKREILSAYPEGRESEKPFKAICREIDGYLKGEVREFSAEVDTSRLLPFTGRVLEELRGIPYGELRSYGWIGERIGYLGAARAVGQAVGRNPVPIIIPCHRVIRRDGSIGGFSLGLSIKERLLSIEGSLDKIARRRE